MCDLDLGGNIGPFADISESDDSVERSADLCLGYSDLQKVDVGEDNVIVSLKLVERFAAYRILGEEHPLAFQLFREHLFLYFRAAKLCLEVFIIDLYKEVSLLNLASFLEINSSHFA